MVWQIALNLCFNSLALPLSPAFFAFLASASIFSIQSKVLQPPSSASSSNASRVPEVGGGPSTSILVAGSAGSTSFQVLLGFAISLPGSLPGTSFASAKNKSFLVSLNTGADLALAIAIPSKPICTSTISLTPFF